MNGFYTKVERHGDDILWAGYDNAGKRFYDKVAYKPTLYTTTNDESVLTSLLTGKKLKPVAQKSMSQATKFIEKYADVSGLEVCGNSNYVAAFTYENYPGSITFDPSLIHIFSFDIEVDISKKKPNMETADCQITSIACKSSKSPFYDLYGVKDYDPTQTITGIDPKYIRYHKCSDERQLLQKFVALWVSDYPDVVTGWNVELFDIAYVVKRVEVVLGASSVKRMSPWGIVRARQFEMFGKPQTTYILSGISVVDYMNAFKKFGYKYGTMQSYKLDHVASVVLGTKKLSYEEYGSLTALYEKNPQLYLDYNLKDTQLIQQFEDQTGLLGLVFTVAYKSGVNFNEAFGTVGVWDTTIYRALRQQNRVPFVKKGSAPPSTGIAGGYVKDPQVGMKRWIVSFDLNSLYPHLMMQYNMSPETYLAGQRADVSQDMVLSGQFRNDSDKFAVAANGVCFNKRFKGIIPQIIEGYYNERATIKQLMLKAESELEVAITKAEKQRLKREITQLHNSQMSIKILMNGLYGSTANIHFIYYINEMAEAITTSGQLSVKWAGKVVNEYLNRVMSTTEVDYVSYTDTDSIYINFGPLVEKVFGTMDITREQGENFLDTICKEKIEPLLDDGYEKLAQSMGAYRNAMKMKREKISDKTIFVAKKRYVMNVLNSEGVHYDTPKVSVTGIDAARSSTPEICRDKFLEAFRIIVNDGEEATQKFIQQFKEEFLSLSAAQIGKVSGTNDIDVYQDARSTYKKGCPIHVRGCLLMNRWIADNGLENKYPLITSGDKIKFVYLKLPNPIRENIIAFVDYPPEELEVEKYIDREKQFEVVFMKPLRHILDSLEWSDVKRNTILHLFG